MPDMSQNSAAHFATLLLRSSGQTADSGRKTFLLLPARYAPAWAENGQLRTMTLVGSPEGVSSIKLSCLRPPTFGSLHIFSSVITAWLRRTPGMLRTPSHWPFLRWLHCGRDPACSPPAPLRCLNVPSFSLGINHPLPNSHDSLCPRCRSSIAANTRWTRFRDLAKRLAVRAADARMTGQLTAIAPLHAAYLIPRMAGLVPLQIHSPDESSSLKALARASSIFETFGGEGVIHPRGGQVLGASLPA